MVHETAIAWLLFNGPEYLESPEVRDIHLPWLTGSETNGALVASSRGYALRLVSIMDGLHVRHIINYQRVGLVLKEIPEDSLVFGIPAILNYNSYRNSLSDLSVENSKKVDELVVPLYREIIYDDAFSEVRSPRSKIKPASYYTKIEKSIFKLEKQVKGWLTISQPGCPTSELSVFQWPEVSTSKYDRRRAYMVEAFFPEDSYLKAVSKPWLLDELWLEHFGREWIPFDLKNRLAKFPETAKLFAERYPQVVPDEAWVLLGGKPS